MLLSLALLDDTSCAPSKSPVVDEVPFQEPSPCVNHPSPESKVTDGNEVPPAENGMGWFCEHVHKNLHITAWGEPDSSESKLF